MHDRCDTEDLKALAHQRMGEILARLDVRDRPNQRGTIVMCNPMRNDKNPSLAIWTHGGVLSWKDFTGAGQGDIIDLVAYLSGWWDLPKRGSAEAIRWLRETLGVARMTDEQRRADAARARKAEAQARKTADEELARQVSDARRMFFGAEPIAGTPAAAYLAARGVPLELLPRGPRGGDLTPGVLKFAPRMKHIWQDKDRRSPRNGEESWWPCMIAACVRFDEDGGGSIEAVHRTWLKPDGSDKAPVQPARKCWPSTAGLVIPLWRGESGLSVKEANANGLRETLAIVEGNEDGLSFVLGDPRPRVWAAISLSNMAAIRLPECIDSVIIHRQNDWLKLSAVAEFERAKQALERQGVPVAEVHAFSGKDINDTIRGD